MIKMKLNELYSTAKNKLNDSLEAQILCEEYLGFGRGYILSHPNEEIENYDEFLNALKRRANGEPLQYILGHWEFDGMDLYLENGVLIPREDTEVLTNESARLIANNSFIGVDLCSGTGAVALSIIKNCKNVKISAVELYDIPYKCLEINCNKYGNGRVDIVKGDIFTLQNNYKNLDFIVSNPPYIVSKEIKTLQSEVQLEPHTALDGGEDGYNFYRHIINHWYNSLKTGGFMAFEIGEEQAEIISILLKERNFSNIKVLKDFNGFNRCVSAIKG